MPTRIGKSNALAVPIALIGFGLPDDNAHAPNEKSHLPNSYRGIEMLNHDFAILPTPNYRARNG